MSNFNFLLSPPPKIRGHNTGRWGCRSSHFRPHFHRSLNKVEEGEGRIHASDGGGN